MRLALALLLGLAGFHAEDPREVTVIARGAPLPAGPVRGGFAMTERGLILEKPLHQGWNYLLPDGAELADGFVRARFVAGQRLDSTVMVRASAAEPLVLDGLGISLEDHALVAYRFSQGVARPLGHRASAAWGNGQRLELTVMLAGPHVSATLVDASSLEAIATLTFTDRGTRAGRAGIRVHSGQDAGSALESLVVLPAGGEAEPEPRAPAGADRVLVVEPGAIPKLPRGLAQVSFVEGERGYVLTDPRGAERLRRMGVAVLEERGEPGWWFYDAGMRTAKAAGPKKTRAGFDINDSYMDAEMIEALLRAYAERFPDITALEEIGRSVEGRPMLALKISDNPAELEDEPAVIFNASHHGSELMAPLFALDAIQQLTERYKRDRAVRALVDDLEIWIVPLVNPDGNWHYIHTSREAGRKNARDLDGDGVFEPWEGVDLNRNYPFRWGALGEVGSRSFGPHTKYRGPSPASEPETRALMALYERVRPVASISFHTAATKILSPYTIDGVRNLEPDVPWAIAEEMAAVLPVQTSRKKYEVARNLYSVDGVDQDWMFHETGAVAYLIEGPLHNTRSARLRRRSVEKTRPGWRYLLDRVHSGPRLYGRVTDAAGKALPAVVRVAEHKRYEGEKWIARPADGRFDRLLAAPGTYTVVAELEGYEVLRKRVRVEGTRRVDLILEEVETEGQSQ
jgi:hypothetical protein